MKQSPLVDSTHVPSSAPIAKPFSRGIMLPLFIILSLDGMGFGLIIPLLTPLFMNVHGGLLPGGTSVAARQFYSGFAMALYPIFVMIGTPLLGCLSDGLGRKKTLLISLLGAFLGLVLAAISIEIHSVILFLISRMVIGLTAASQSLAQAAVADVSHHKTRARRFSIIALAMTIGMVAGPLVGGYLSDAQLVFWFNPTVPFLAAAFIALFNSFLLMTCFQEEAKVRPASSLRLSSLLKNCLGIFSSGRLLLLMILFFLLEASWSLYFQSMPLILGSTYRLSPEDVGLFIAFLGACMGIGLAGFFPWFNKRYALRHIVVIALSVGACSLLIAAFSSGEAAQWGCAVPLTLAVGVGYTALLALISHEVPAYIQGWMMGFAMALLAAAWAVTGIFLGFLLQEAMRLPLLLAGGLMLVALLGCLKFSKQPEEQLAQFT